MEREWNDFFWFLQPKFHSLSDKNEPKNVFLTRSMTFLERDGGVLAPRVTVGVTCEHFQHVLLPPSCYPRTYSFETTLSHRRKIIEQEVKNKQSETESDCRMEEEEEDSMVLSMMQQCVSSVVLAELPKKRKRDHRELPREGKREFRHEHVFDSLFSSWFPDRLGSYL